MKKKLLLLWLLLPVPVIALHYSSGQRWIARDDAGRLLAKAADAEKRQCFSEAAACYLEAASKLDKQDGPAKTKCEIAAARARVNDGDAAVALERLDSIMDAESFDTLPEEIRRDTRDLYASTSYYAAWVMRLEGATHDEWSGVAEEARQQYRLLAEHGEAGQTGAAQKNLEAAVRLERMGLTELMAKPLPKQCQGMCNKNLKEKMCKRCNGKCNKPGNKPAKQPKDIRDDKEKNKGLSERTEGMGS